MMLLIDAHLDREQRCSLLLKVFVIATVPSINVYKPDNKYYPIHIQMICIGHQGKKTSLYPLYSNCKVK